MVFHMKKSRDEVEKQLEISNITATDLQDEIKGPVIIGEYRKEVSETMKNDKYKNILAVQK